MRADHASAQSEVERLVAVARAVKLLPPLFQCAGVVHGQLVAVFTLPRNLAPQGASKGRPSGVPKQRESGAPTLGCADRSMWVDTAYLDGAVVW